jgi:phage/conjugal plasmid C-4 type zinc finger TraR family protein
MATGWAREGAVQEQIDATVKDAIARARDNLPAGASLAHCAECGADIPEARRAALPGVRLCVECQVPTTGRWPATTGAAARTVSCVERLESTHQGRSLRNMKNQTS